LKTNKGVVDGYGTKKRAKPILVYSGRRQQCNPQKNEHDLRQEKRGMCQKREEVTTSKVGVGGGGWTVGVWNSGRVN